MNYYDQNADKYIASTIKVDMQIHYDRVLPLLASGARVLEVGSGSGRDAKFFCDRGFAVTAIDPSEVMGALAARYSSIQVRKLRVQDLDYEDEFELIWACASLLHVPFSEMPMVWHKLSQALVEGGILYVTLKKGGFEGIRAERWYCDYTLEKLNRSGFSATGLRLEYTGESFDLRPGREDEVWLNALFKKVTGDR